MSSENVSEVSKGNTGMRMGILWLKIALVYFIVLVAFGLVMSIKGNFQFASVHSHIGLMGWVSVALAGVIYCLFPKAGESRLGYIHFWIFNISLPVTLVSLFMFAKGQVFVEPILAIGSTLYVIGVICFALNIFLNIGKGQ